MSFARRRLRCVRRTSGSCLDAKRDGVQAGHQRYKPRMSKEMTILNRKLCWHEGVGISNEAGRKHAEAIIRGTGASNLTSLKITMSKENKEDVRDKKDDIVENRKLGKLGMKEQPLIGQILSPAETTRYRALAATANFIAFDRGDIVYCAKELTRHMATPSGSRIVRLRESVGRNSGTHIDVQRLRHAHEWSGTGRCERWPDEGWAN